MVVDVLLEPRAGLYGATPRNSFRRRLAAFRRSASFLYPSISISAAVGMHWVSNAVRSDLLGKYWLGRLSLIWRLVFPPTKARFAMSSASRGVDALQHGLRKDVVELEPVLRACVVQRDRQVDCQSLAPAARKARNIVLKSALRWFRPSSSSGATSSVPPATAGAQSAPLRRQLVEGSQDPGQAVSRSNHASSAPWHWRPEPSTKSLRFLRSDLIVSFVAVETERHQQERRG